MSAVPVRAIFGCNPERGHVGAMVGVLTDIDPEGVPRVQFDGAPAEGVLARVAVPESSLPALECLVGMLVLLVFENADSERPIITGLIRSSFRQPLSSPDQVSNPKSLLLEAEDEIVIKCGEGSIALRRDGHIVIKGKRIMSRAIEENKIRGASVLIN